MVVQGETHLQQQPTLQDSRGNLTWRADSAQQDSVVLANRVEVGIGEELAIAQVATRAQVILGGLDVVPHRVEHLEGLCSNFWADSVSANNRQFHFAGFLSRNMDTSATLANPHAFRMKREHMGVRLTD